MKMTICLKQQITMKEIKPCLFNLKQNYKKNLLNLNNKKNKIVFKKKKVK